MRTLSPWWLGVAAAILIWGAGMAPASAAESTQTIAVSRAADLALPAAQAPVGFTPRAARSHVLSDADLGPLIGYHMLAIFHQSGYIAGYHTWLDGNNPQGAPFVTMDLFGFHTLSASRVARLAYQQLVLGVQLDDPDPTLPKSATVWTDGTGTFGPDQQPYAVAEIVFRVANVVADVTGFYIGSGETAIEAALKQATAVTVATVRWLSTRMSAPPQTGLLLLVPIAALPETMRRARQGRK